MAYTVMQITRNNWLIAHHRFAGWLKRSPPRAISHRSDPLRTTGDSWRRNRCGRVSIRQDPFQG